MNSTSIQIPIINFQPFIDGDKTARQAVVEQIYQACYDVGFMYIKNPGVSQETVNHMFAKAQQFFNLPFEVKQQLAWSDEFSNYGYIGIERERLNPNKPGDLKEAFNISKNNSATFANSINQCSVEKEFCHIILAFSETCTLIANNILQAFAVALKLPDDFFTIRHNQQNHTLRLLHYPPLPQLPKTGQIRAGEHSDYGSITLLFQDEVGGLEVQAKSGEWIAAPSIPGTVVVNTGDLMQRWTNNIFCSTKHRVVNPPDDLVKQSRYSVAFFCHPNNEVEISCLPSCQGSQSAIYAPISAGDYLISRLQTSY